MKITKRSAEDVAILEVEGALKIGRGDVMIRESVQKSVEEGNRKILVDLRGVTVMDSSGLAELTSGFTLLTHRGGVLKLLITIPSKIHDILGITQLISVFEMFTDEETALRSFN